MGVFDKNKLKYNDAIPNPHKEDGIDIVKCDNDECNCRDSNGYCLYETCAVEIFNKVKYHKKFTHKCNVCNTKYTKDITDYPMHDLSYFICPDCMNKLRSILSRE